MTPGSLKGDVCCGGHCTGEHCQVQAQFFPAPELFYTGSFYHCLEGMYAISNYNPFICNLLCCVGLEPKSASMKYILAQEENVELVGQPWSGHSLPQVYHIVHGLARH